MRGTALAAAGLPDLCCSSRCAYLLRAGLGWAGDVYRLREHAPYKLVGIGYFCLREYDVGQREAGGFGIGIGISIGVATSDNHHLSSLLILFQKIQTSHTKHTKHTRINKQQDQQTAQSDTK